MVDIKNGEVLEQYGITPDMLGYNEYDPTPTGGLNETDYSQRGIWKAPLKNGQYLDGKLTLTLKNNTTNKILVEMFNALRNITKYPNDAYYGNAQFTDFSATPYKPFSSEAALAFMKAQSDAIKNGNGITDFSDVLNSRAVISDASGALLYCGSGSGGFSTGTTYGRDFGQASDHDIFPLTSINSLDSTARATVQCGQIPYSSLLAQSESLVLLVKKWNFSLSSEAQKQNDIYYERVSVFGAKNSNSDNLVVSPNQYQNKIFDVNQMMAIDKRTGLFWSLEPNETVIVTMYVRAFRDNGIIATGLN